jgi:hypothetical protein
MSPVRFEPTISAGERPQTYALDCAATGTSFSISNFIKYIGVLTIKKTYESTVMKCVVVVTAKLNRHWVHFG